MRCDRRDPGLDERRRNEGREQDVHAHGGHSHAEQDADERRDEEERRHLATRELQQQQRQGGGEPRFL